MCDPSGKVLICVLDRTDGIIEVRCGYGDDDPQQAADLRRIDRRGEGQRLVVETKSGFATLGIGEA